MPVLSAGTELVQFEEAAHLYTVAGVQRPSVTQIRKDAGLIDATWYTDEARERGRAVHLARISSMRTISIGTQFCRSTAATSRPGRASYSTRDHALTTFPYHYHWQVFAAAVVVWHAKHKTRPSHAYTRSTVSAA